MEAMALAGRRGGTGTARTNKLDTWIRSPYADHVLGCWFAGTLLSVSLSRTLPVSKQALTSLPLAALVLIKGTGLALALAAVASRWQRH